MTPASDSGCSGEIASKHFSQRHRRHANSVCAGVGTRERRLGGATLSRRSPNHIRLVRDVGVHTADIGIVRIHHPAGPVTAFPVGNEWSARGTLRDAHVCVGRGAFDKRIRSEV